MAWQARLNAQEKAEEGRQAQPHAALAQAHAHAQAQARAQAQRQVQASLQSPFSQVFFSFSHTLSRTLFLGPPLSLRASLLVFLLYFSRCRS